MVPPSESANNRCHTRKECVCVCGQGVLLVMVFLLWIESSVLWTQWGKETVGGIQV